MSTAANIAQIRGAIRARRGPPSFADLLAADPTLAQRIQRVQVPRTVGIRPLPVVAPRPRVVRAPAQRQPRPPAVDEGRVNQAWWTLAERGERITLSALAAEVGAGLDTMGKLARLYGLPGPFFRGPASNPMPSEARP